MKSESGNIQQNPQGGGERLKHGGCAPAEAGATSEAVVAAPGLARRGRAVLLLVLLAAGTVAAWASGFGASLRGRVRDEAGNALAGVRVRLVHAGKGIVRQTLSDEKGRFLFGNLFFEAHELTAELDGYRPYSRTGLVPRADDGLRVDIVLRAEDGAGGDLSLFRDRPASHRAASFEGER